MLFWHSFNPYFCPFHCTQALIWSVYWPNPKGGLFVPASVSCVYNLLHRFHAFRAYLMCVFPLEATPSSEVCVIQVWHVALVNGIAHHSWFGAYHTWYLSFCWHQHHFQLTPKNTLIPVFWHQKTQNYRFLHQNTNFFDTRLKCLTPASHVVHVTNIRYDHVYNYWANIIFVNSASLFSSLT